MKQFLKSSLVAFFSLTTLAAPVITVVAQETAYPVNEAQIATDFYDAVNADYLESLEIPSDHFAAGSFYQLDEEMTELLKTDLAAMAAGDISLDSHEQEEMVEFYQMALDKEGRESQGVDAIQPYFDQVEAVENYEDLNELLIEWYSWDLPSVFGLGVTPDMKNSEQYALMASTPYLILPDKTSYDNPIESQMMLGLFRLQTLDVLKLYGFEEDEAERLADETIEFDQLLVDSTLSAEEASDIEKIYNPTPLSDFQNSSSYIDIAGVYEEYYGDTEAEEIIVTNPDYFEKMDDIINEETFSLVKSWLTVSLATTYTPYFTEDLRDAGSQFSMAMTGQEELPPEDEMAALMTMDYFSMVMGDYYGQTYFGEDSKQEVEAMVEELIEAYQKHLTNNEWLSQETIDKALLKLDTMETQIGFPDEYNGFFTEIQIDSSISLFENVLAYNLLSVEDMIITYEEPVDRTEWYIPSYMVNAFYDPQTNTIIFPAAILQAPFYSAEQSYSENLGGIGAVIAHEISHAFDPNGALFDEKGNFVNWWTEEDYTAFEKRADQFVAFWDGVEYGSGTVNGELTKTENIADLAGLSVAEEVLHNTEEADFEAFYENFARIWAVKYRPELEAILLQTDVHAPDKLRTNLNVQQLDSFYETFDIQEDDAMFLPEDERISLW